jgi:hypothetical protein
VVDVLKMFSERDGDDDDEDDGGDDWQKKFNEMTLSEDDTQ